MDRILVLLRHGQSDWNHKDIFTGWKDPDLTLKGVEEARAAGRCLKAQGLFFDRAFTSNLVRARHTLQLVLTELGTPQIKVTHDRALNERDYGMLCGVNKEDAIRKWGSEQVALWRRGYDVRPPGGESLKETLARVLPYYYQRILPLVLAGQRVIIVGHGNSLSTLVMVFDHLTPETMAVELPTGVPLVYYLNPDATVTAKETLEPKRAEV
jgi:2,3-bisphosphoglycerate-dependent phosphoglycerate mutase